MGAAAAPGRFALGVMAAVLASLAGGCRKEEELASGSKGAVGVPHRARAEPAWPTTADGGSRTVSRAPFGRTGVSKFLASSSPDNAGADVDDAADAPAYLPQSGDVAGWIKSQGVRTGGPDGLAELAADRGFALQVGPFRIRRVAVVRYERQAADDRQVAEVWAIETATAADAFGILACQSTSRMTLPVGTLTRLEWRGGLRLHTWQGTVYLRIRGQGQDRRSLLAGCRALAAYIVRGIPDEDPPPLLQALPTEGLVEGRQWIVRGLASLAGPGAREIPVGDAATVGRLLGLDGEALMLIAAYRVPGDPSLNYVWVVQYSGVGQARRAYLRYSDYLQRSREPWAQVTLLRAPRGRYLCGSWTAEQESIAQVLPRLWASLP